MHPFIATAAARAVGGEGSAFSHIRGREFPLPSRSPELRNISLRGAMTGLVLASWTGNILSCVLLSDR